MNPIATCISHVDTDLRVYLSKWGASIVESNDDVVQVRSEIEADALIWMLTHVKGQLPLRHPA